MLTRTQTARRLVGALALCLAVLPGTALAAEAEAPAVKQLSDEFKLSRWAHVNAPAKIHRSPSRRSRSVARLRYFTEDRLPEIYLALRATTDDAGREWVQVRIPRRPNGQTGWVERENLGPFRVVRTQLRIERRRLRATLYRNGRAVWRAPIGIGRPDWPTPAGRFYIREKLTPARPDGIYGIVAFGTSAYSRRSDWPGGAVIGIHGTNQPQLIPGRPSHGCIRVKNPAIKRLTRLMPLGTPVWIR